MTGHLTRYGRTTASLSAGVQPSLSRVIRRVSPMVAVPHLYRPRPRRASRASGTVSYSLVPPPDHRMLTVGMTGSGKTTFNRALLMAVHGKRPILILDT